MSGKNKNLKIITMTSISIILLGSIALFSQPVYAPHLVSGLVVHYDFEDEMDPTADLSGHGNAGDLSASAGFSSDVPPLPGNTKSLDLTTDNLVDYLKKSMVNDFPSDEITTTLWVKSSGIQNADPAFVSYATSAGIAGTNDWGVQNVGTTDSEFQGFVNNDVLRTTDMPDVLDGSWHHVAVSWDSLPDGEMKLYMDGVLIKSDTEIETGESIAADGTLVLGQEQDCVGDCFNANDDFNGFLDDVRIYDRVLSDEEIEELFDPIKIDIKPGSDPNSINPRSMGLVPVAILGSDSLDVADVDVSTLAFGPDGADPVHGGHVADVNNDGFDDLVTHYRQKETGIAPGDTEACLTGDTFDPIPFEDCDDIKTPGP